MDLNLINKLFIVPGASSGFGRAILEQLVSEGANVIAIARTKEPLEKVTSKYPKNVIPICGDITLTETMKSVLKQVGNRYLSGVVINAGGPPAKSFIETKLQDWDDAYQKLLRWKVEFVQLCLPKFIDQQYGRFVFIESSSVKQPIENLILSTSLRLSVVGMMKTLSQEIADQGITLNVIAPAYHNTPAMQRLFAKKAEIDNISVEEAKAAFEAEIKTGKMGEANDLASLAVWLLSEKSSFVTGQTYALEGGTVKSTL